MHQRFLKQTETLEVTPKIYPQHPTVPSSPKKITLTTLRITTIMIIVPRILILIVTIMIMIIMITIRILTTNNHERIPWNSTQSESLA